MSALSDLETLGRRHRRLLRELEAVRSPLHEAMRAARADGATQADIRDRTGYRTIHQVRVILGEASPSRRTPAPG